MNFDMNEILRENAQKGLDDAAKDIYLLFRSLCKAGFTEDQAMQIVMATIGNIRNGVTQ